MKRLHVILAIILSPVLLSTAAAQGGGSLLDFDGVNDRVMVPYSTSFPTAVFTVSTWIRTPGAAFGRRVMVARGEDSVTGNGAWSLYMQTDGTFHLRIEDINDADYSYPSGVFIADNVWHHVVATRDASNTVSLYVDGQMAASFGGTGVPSSANQQFLTLGCSHGTFGPPTPANPVHPLWFFPGEIDEAAMWNVALTPAGVSNVFTLGVNPQSAALVGYWPLDEGSGQAVNDLSAAGNHGFRGANNVSSGDSADPQWVVTSVTSYPGTGEDFILETLVNNAGNPLADVKTASATDALAIGFSSPGGTFDFFPVAVGAQLFVPGTPPAPALFPGTLHLDFSGTLAAVLVYGAPHPLFGAPILPPSGTWLAFTVPMGLSGTSVMIQTFAISFGPPAANNIAAFSDGHEIQIQ